LNLAIEIAQRIYAEESVLGASPTYEELMGRQYRLHPVRPEVFLFDDAYAGKYGRSLYGKWKDELVYVLDPANGITEWIMTGAIGLGKCCHERTYVNTDQGFLRIGEIIENRLNLNVQSESGSREVQLQHDEGMTETRRVVTTNGHLFEGRPNHRVRVLSGLEIVWRSLDELVPGDCVLQSPATCFGKNAIPLEAAELLGWAVAEGSRDDSSGVSDVLSLDRSVVPYVASLARASAGYFGCTVHESVKHGRVFIRGGAFRSHLPFEYSRNKQIPPVIMQASAPVIRAFLRGYFSGDGDAATGGSPAVTTVSSDLAEQIRVLFVSLGYYCSVREGVASYFKSGRRVVTGPKYTIRVVGRDSIRKFADEIGFVQPYKQEAILLRSVRENRNDDHWFSFKLTVDAADQLAQMQPRFNAKRNPYGVTKQTSPRRKVSRLKGGQGCTVRLLKEIAVHGVLPDVLQKIADGELLFDTVESVTSSFGRCCDLTVADDPSYVSGGFISHNSTVAALALTYKLYLLGCLLNPAKFFNLMEDSAIVFGVYSLFKYKSQDDNYALLKTMIDGIPFFRQEFPRPRHTSALGSDTLDFPHRVSVLAGSTELHAIGLNLMCLLMDEVNFMKETEKSGTSKRTATLSEKVSQAHNLYTASKRRLESRFQYRGVNPGLMILISSRNAETSWLEKHIQELSTASNVHISDYALWDVKREVMGYSGKRFFVEVGDFLHPSRIIDSPKDARIGSKVVAPPVEHHEEFVRDIEGALRDIAGVANVSISPLIRDRDSIKAAIDPKLSHPFTMTQFPITHLDDVEISRFHKKKSVIRYVKSFPKPLLNPSAVRFLHIDLAETQDAAGIAMGHISKISGSNPHISLDFMLRIMAPVEGEIDFSKIVDFVLYLQKDCGYPIKRISFDRFQSTHARQILTKLGFESPHFSVDKTDEAYIVLRSTLSEGRLLLYDYPPLVTELATLIHDRVKRKVDHPEGGSKDVSDSVAAVVFQLTEAMGKDERIRAMSSTDDLIVPQPVRSLEEMLQDVGSMASAVSGSQGSLV